MDRLTPFVLLRFYYLAIIILIIHIYNALPVCAVASLVMHVFHGCPVRSLVRFSCFKNTLADEIKSYLQCA